MAIYLDPGTGSLVIQFTVGAITGLLVAGRLFGRNLAAFLRGKSKAPHSSGQNDPKRDIQDASVSAEHSDEPVK